MVDETLPRSPGLQHADERHTVVDALGRTSYTPQPKVHRGISEPRSAGARIPMPWAGFLLGARGRPANRPGLLFVVVGLILLLLLDCGPRTRFALSKRARHLSALSCASPILVCSPRATLLPGRCAGCSTQAGSLGSVLNRAERSECASVQQQNPAGGG